MLISTSFGNEILSTFILIYNVKSISVYFRRNILLPNVDTPPSRRPSFQAQDFIEFTKPQPNLRNFYIFFIILFLCLFLSIIYSFIRMIKNPD